MSDYRFGDDYKLSIYPKDAMDGCGGIDMNKVEAVEIEWVDFIRKPDDKSRWAELFGTPERTVRTLERAELETLDYCAMVNSKCDKCRYEPSDGYGCYDPAPLLEWLRGDA